MNLSSTITRLGQCLFLFAGIFVAAQTTPSARAATRTWVLSPTDPTWSDGANWGGTAPGGNDAVAFNDSVITNLNNDIAPQMISGITFNDTTNSSYVVTNNTIWLNGTITDDSSQPQTLDVSLLLTNGTKTITVVPGGNLILGGFLGDYPLAGQNAGLTISQSYVAPNQFISGAGFNYAAPATVTLNGNLANALTNTTTIGVGTALILEFTNMSVPVNLLSTNIVTMNGGSYSIIGSPSTATFQSNAPAGTLTMGTGGNAIVVNANGGPGTTLAVGNTWTRNSPSTLNVDISGGGTLVASPVTGNGVLGYATVKDATGIGFATTNLPTGNIIRYNSATALTSAANSTVTNFVTSGTLTMNATSFAVNSLSLNASSGNGVLDLGGPGDVLTNTSKGIMMVGANNFTLQDGQVAPGGTEIILHQMGSGVLTNNATIGAGAAFLTKNGPGTLVLNAASTNTGTSVINDGMVQLGISSSPGSGPFGNTTNGLTINAGGVLDLDGHDLTVGAFNANGIGVVTNSAGGAPAVFTIGNGNSVIAGYNSTFFCGNMTLKVTGTGTSANLNNLANAHTGGIIYAGNNSADRVYNPASFGSGPLVFGGAGQFLIPSSSITGWSTGFSNAIIVNGTGNVWNMQNNGPTTLLSTGPWTGAGTLTMNNSYSPTFTFGGDISGFQGTLILLGTGTTYSLAIGYVNTNLMTAGSAQAVFDLQSTNTGAVNLQYNNTNTPVTVRLGDLNTAGATGTGTIQVRNNAAGTVSTFEVGALNANSTFSGNIVNNSGTVAVTKVGTGTWTLTSSSLSYTGPTTVSNGVLTLNGALSSSPVNVFGPGGLAGSGSVGGPVSLMAGNAGILLTNNGAATLTLNGGLTLSNGNVLAFDIGTPSASDLIALGGSAFSQTGTAKIYFATISGFGAGTYTLISGASGINAANFTVGNTLSGYSLTLSNDASDLYVTVAVAAPAAAFWDNRSDTNWTTVNNWDTDQSSGIALVSPPSIPTDVTFAANGASRFNTTLGGNFSIHSLTLSTPNNVTINGANTLTISAGINNSGASNVINASVALGTDQAWANNASYPFTVNSNIMGAHALTINDNGQGVVLNGVNSYTGGTYLESGTLILGNCTNTLADSGTVFIDNNSTLSLGTNNDTVGAVGLSANGGNITGTGMLTASSYALTNGTVSAKLGGNGSTLLVDGSGTVILSGANSYTGATTINSGTLVLAGNNSAATGPIAVNGTLELLTSPTAVSPSSLINLATSQIIQLESDTTTTFTCGGINAGMVANFTANEATGAGIAGSTLTLNGPLTWTASGTTLNADGGNNYNLGLGDLFGGNGGNATLNADSINLIIHSFNGLGNSSSLTFTGPNNISVMGGITNNPTKGLGLIFNQGGTVTLWGAESLTGSGPVTGSAFTVNSGAVVINNSGAISAPRGSVTLGLVVGTGGDSGAELLLGGTDPSGLTGGITMIKNIIVEDGGATPNNGPMIIGGQNTSGTNVYTGTITLGTTNSGASEGMSATLLSATGGEVDVTGGVLQVGTDTMAGVTVGDAVHAGIVKLLGANTYGGPTMVTNGTLAISTLHSGGGNFVMNDGTTLGVTNALNDGSALMGNLTLGGNGPTTTRFDNVASTTLPVINAASTVTVNGSSTIIISTNNVIGVPGEYPLIKYGTLSGVFRLTTPTNFVAVLTNDVSNSWIALKVLSVYTPVNTNPTNLTATTSGSTLTLSWPADHTGWRLLMQTNSLAAGLSANTNDWTPVAGSAEINQTNLQINPALPTVFYRLVYP